METRSKPAAELEGRARELELRKAILEGTVELLGKDPGGDPNRLTNREKTLLVGSLRPSWALKDLLAGVGLGKSSYYYQVGAIAVGDKDAELREQVRAVFDASDKTYGRRRVHDELAAGGSPAGERRIVRIMREGRLAARGRKRRRGYGSYRGGYPDAPATRWGATSARGRPTPRGSPTPRSSASPRARSSSAPCPTASTGRDSQLDRLDQPQRRDGQLDAEELVETAPDRQRRFLVRHSDCGCRHRWPEWISIREEAGITRSMSAKSCSPDNSAMEASLEG